MAPGTNPRFWGFAFAFPASLLPLILSEHIYMVSTLLGLDLAGQTAAFASLDIGRCSLASMLPGGVEGVYKCACTSVLSGSRQLVCLYPCFGGFDQSNCSNYTKYMLHFQACDGLEFPFTSCTPLWIGLQGPARIKAPTSLSQSTTHNVCCVTARSAAHMRLGVLCGSAVGRAVHLVTLTGAAGQMHPTLLAV